MNILQSVKQQENIKAVKEIIKSHKTHNTSKIKDFLLAEYNLPVTKRSIRRYLITIKKGEFNEAKIVKPKTKIAKKKPMIKIQESKFPYIVKDPSGKEHKITSENMTIEISWGNQGLIFFDTEDKIWRYSHDNKPFDSQKKIKPWRKIRSKLCFEYDDLND